VLAYHLKAPTGSGKTTLFELAIIRLLKRQLNEEMTSRKRGESKVIYVAPLKALCQQIHDEWSMKFGLIGVTVKELTGDTELQDLRELNNVDIILT
jgi:ATP-dependent DNA helicase HFM1/MER3